MTSLTPATPLAKARGLWQQNHDLLLNAGSLAASTGLASAFGFVYWVVAAREFSQEAVGYGAAAINAMGLFGTIGMFGLGTMLIGELPQRRSQGGLTMAALVASGIGSFVLGLIFPLLVDATGAHFPEITGSPIRLLLFAVGVGFTGSTLVFDDATIGLMRGGVQLSRNLVMSIAKLAVLPIVAVVVHDAFGVGLVLSWVFGTAASLIPAAMMLKRGGRQIFHKPDWKLLRRLGKVAMAHNWLNLAIATPPKLLPVIVTVVVSPSANAAFYVAWMLSGFLFMVPAHLSTVLFAIASASPELIAEKLRFVLRLSLTIGLPAMAVLAMCAHFALNIFGSSYAHLATIPLWFLILAYIPALPKAQYIAVCRATGRVNKAAIVLTVCAAFELAAVVIGGKIDGLNGLSFAYVVVVMIEGVVTAPTVLRAAYARTVVATSSVAAVNTSERITARNSQETGIAALLALASAAVSEGHTLDVATEVWRTGEFPAIPTASERDATVNKRAKHAADAPTKLDLYTNQQINGLGERLSYRQRQQAAVDALIALAVSVNREDNGTQ